MNTKRNGTDRCRETNAEEDEHDGIVNSNRFAPAVGCCQSEQDAMFLCERYSLPCVGLLQRILQGMYRHPIAGNGPEFRDGRPIPDEELKAFHAAFAVASQAVDRLRASMQGPTRRGFSHVVDTLSWYRLVEVRCAIDTICQIGKARTEPIDAASAFLPEWINYIGGYLLIVTGVGPRFSSMLDEPRTVHRQIVDDILQITGWSYTIEEVDAVCAVAERDLHSLRPGSCGLRVLKSEREEAKIWRAGRDNKQTI